MDTIKGKRNYDNVWLQTDTIDSPLRPFMPYTLSVKIGVIRNTKQLDAIAFF